MSSNNNKGEKNSDESYGGFSLTAEKIKAEAQNLGFSACGIARAARISDDDAARFGFWIRQKNYASMSYMANNTDKRLDPRLLMPGLKSIVCLALNYAPARRLPAGELQFAAYALGQDYHDLMKARLHALAARLKLGNYRAFCDTAPVLERYWAVQAGLGWIGRNHQLIIPDGGSMFFLGELFIDVEVSCDMPMPSRCGRCDACIRACPTGALSCSGNTGSSVDGKLQPGEDGTVGSFRSDLCLSYQTIENRGDIPEPLAAKMGDTVYGCDRCQQACPWNRFAKPTAEKLLQPKPELLSMTREKWSCLTVEEYRRLFKGSAVKRAKYEGLMRNIKAVNGSGGTDSHCGCRQEGEKTDF